MTRKEMQMGKRKILSELEVRIIDDINLYYVKKPKDPKMKTMKKSDRERLKKLEEEQ